MTKFYYWEIYDKDASAIMIVDPDYTFKHIIANIFITASMPYIDIYGEALSNKKVAYTAHLENKSLQECIQYVDTILAKCGYTLLTDKLKILL
jgi:hypothetical protein